MTDQRLSDQAVRLPDGRTLAYAEWGDPDGFPVLALHGTPGGRLERHPDPTVPVRAGARLITYDRPGYGSSDRLPGRRVVDCVPDVEVLMDALGVQSFAVTGVSGGGPHALAVAARLGPRVVRARCQVGVAPVDADGLDFFAGMDPLNVTEFSWALEGEDVLAPQLERELHEMAERVAQDPSTVLGDGWDLDDADRAVLARPDIADNIRESTADLVRGGVWGWVDDSLAFTRAWGFELDEISVPVEVRYGAQDVLVPAAHGAWLARRVPGASVVVEQTGGHLSDPDTAVDRLRWLATGG